MVVKFIYILLHATFVINDSCTQAKMHNVHLCPGNLYFSEGLPNYFGQDTPFSKSTQTPLKPKNFKIISLVFFPN